MSKYSRNELYINQLENDIMALNKKIDELIVENSNLKQQLEQLNKPKINIPDLDYPDKYYWEGRN